jgi:MerR family copper efflux transcriptional regulator
MRIGKLADKTGVAASRIRFYEQYGLLPAPARRNSGYRDYDESVVEVLRFIRLARGLDFSLGEIAAHLAAPPGPERKRALCRRMKDKLKQLDHLAVQLGKQRSLLRNLIAEINVQESG